ncbi:uncharacterized protein LOC119683828 [Teleopsis dalmanni]|uniref:uncharacterized protein LOC119683828 n=1 Tax=Teleopsis dalmanni TaxID=139649 RepID=UPI0018CDCF98|nr:uncharacterized protein LOC119683828 [Teleopsis dalmanni]
MIPKQKDAALGKHNYSKGDIVLACFHDGVYYKAKIIQLAGDGFSCIVNYIDYNEVYSVGFEKIKPLNIDTSLKNKKVLVKNDVPHRNKDHTEKKLKKDIKMFEVCKKKFHESDMVLADNHITQNLQYLVGDKVMATYDDGVEYIAEITKIGENGKCIVKFIEYNDLYETSVNEIKHTLYKSLNKPEDHLEVVSALNGSHQGTIKKEFAENKLRVSLKDKRFKESIDNMMYTKIIRRNESPKNFSDIGKTNKGNTVRVSHDNRELRDAQIVKLPNLCKVYSEDINKICGSNIQNNKRHLTTKSLNKLSEFVDVMNDKNGVIIRDIQSDGVMHQTSGDDSKTVFKFDKTELFNFRKGDHVLAAYTDGEYYPAKIVKISRKKNSCKVVYTEYDDTLYKIGFNKIKSIDVKNKSITKDSSSKFTTAFLKHSAQPLQVKHSSNTSSDAKDIIYSAGDNVLAFYNDEKFPAVIISMLANKKCIIKYDDTYYGELYEISLEDIEPNKEKNFKSCNFKNEKILVRKSEQISVIPEYSEGEEVFVKYEDGKYYKAIIVNIFSNSNSCVVKYIDYDECCEMSMNNIKRVDEISDNDTESPITSNKIEVQDLLTNDSTKMSVKNYIPEFKIGQKVLALHEDGELYLAIIVIIFSNSNSCVVKYIDYDEYCGLSMNNIIRVDEIFDNDTGTPITRNKIEVQDLLTNDSTKMDERNYITVFKIGQKVLALHEDGEFYLAKIVTIFSNSNSCIVKYIDYDEYCEVSMNNIIRVDEISDNDTGTPITTNKIDVQKLLTNDSTKIDERYSIPEFKIGQKVLALHEDGEFYLAKIVTIFSNSNSCIVKYIDYDEYCEVSMNNIIRVDEISDNDTGIPITTNKIDVQKLLTNDSTKIDKKYSIPKFKIGQKVLALHEDGELYLAKIVTIFSNSYTCLVKYIDYDDCCEVSMNNIIRVDEISDNDTGTPITTNKIYIQELLKNDSTKMDERKYITEFKVGQKVLALYEDGKFYPAEIVTISSNSNSCVIKYIDYDECCEVSMSNIKIVNEISDNDTGTPITTNKIYIQELLKNDSTKMDERKYITEFKVGQKVLALHEDGKFYPAEIVTIFSNSNSCVVKYIDYDECCEVSMNNIIRVDKISHNNTGTPITTNKIEVQELLTNDSTKIDEKNYITEFKTGQKVLALYEDGHNYSAKVTEYDGNPNKVEINVNKIKPIQNKVSDDVSLNTKESLKKKSKAKYSEDDQIIVKFADGNEYTGTIFEIIDDNYDYFIIKNEDQNTFAKVHVEDIYPREAKRFQNNHSTNSETENKITLPEEM